VLWAVAPPMKQRANLEYLAWRGMNTAGAHTKKQPTGTQRKTRRAITTNSVNDKQPAEGISSCAYLFVIVKRKKKTENTQCSKRRGRLERTMSSGGRRRGLDRQAFFGLRTSE